MKLVDLGPAAWLHPYPGIVVRQISNDYLNRGPSTAFIYNSRTGDMQLLAVPGALSSSALEINASGQVIGNLSDAQGDHGFLYSQGIYTVIDMPGEFGHTRLSGINDTGTVVGSAYDDANTSSFILRNGVFQTFTMDGLSTLASDINNAEQIVGWTGVSGTRRGFAWQAGTGVTLDIGNNGASTYAHTINNLGVMGGLIEGDGVGFLARVSAVPEPARWVSMSVGLLLLVTHRRRARRMN